MRYLSKQQVESVLHAAYKASSRDHLMILLGFTHGLRRSEVARLTLGDVANEHIRIFRLKNSLDTTHPLRGSVNILFDEKLALRTWLGQREAESKALFPSRDGRGFISSDMVYLIMRRYMQAAGIPSELAHPHALKHACCALQARRGVPIERIAQYVGHRDIKNTRIYLGISDEEAAESAFAALP